MSTRWSPGRPPWMDSEVVVPARLFVPPTSCAVEILIPGMSTAVVNCVRDVGIASITSAPSTRCCAEFWTSTMGDAPVTVIVSCTVPTLSSTFTVAANDPVSSMPSRLNELNPASANVTA